MTRRLPFTEATIRRTIIAARKAGLEVNAVSVAPDGTITVHRVPEGVVQPGAGTHNGSSSEWEDLKA
jgi:hypothetical protein